MVQVTFIDPAGRTIEIDAKPGWSLMQAATAKMVDGIEAECGGACACATCHCYLEGEAAAVPPPPGATELAMLDMVAAEQRPNSRLTCQVKVTPELEGLVIRVPDRQS